MFFENFASCRGKNSRFDSITQCKGLLLLCFPSYLGLRKRQAASCAMLALPGCSVSSALLTRVVGTVEYRGAEVAELALHGRDRTNHPTHQGVYNLSALEGGAGSWSS